jgi:hypothetical protein
MDERELAARARQVQNFQVKITLGLIAGGIVGLIIGAWVILPALGMTLVGIVAAFASIFVGALIGQRLVLNALR